MFEPRLPLTAAEEPVAWERVDNFILGQRRRVEGLLQQRARDLAQSVHLHEGAPSMAAYESMVSRAGAAAVLVYRQGYAHTESELRQLRESKGHRPKLVHQGFHADRYAATVIRRSAAELAREFLRYVQRSWQRDGYETMMQRQAQLLHNAVLGHVGRVFNLGRTAAALGQEPVTITASVAPAVYAMRSEQLDSNTCGPCDRIHGTIYEIGSSDYFDSLPPSGCLGLGRCRGIMVYGDELSDFSVSPGQLRI